MMYYTMLELSFSVIIPHWDVHHNNHHRSSTNRSGHYLRHGTDGYLSFYNQIMSTTILIQLPKR
jgi:hypothetical protein